MMHDLSDRLDVLYLIGRFQLRGSYARTLSLIERIPSKHVRMRIVTNDPVAARLVSPNVKTTRDIHLSRYLKWPALGTAARHFLASDIRRTPPDLIDIQHRTMHQAGSRLAQQLKCPYVITVHDYLKDRETFAVHPRWCQKVIAVSESVKKELLERTNLPEEKVVVIPNGVRPPAETELSLILFPGRNPVIGTAGALETGKGLDHFLKAASLVVRQYPDIMFLIAGTGPEERPLRNMADSLGLANSLTILPDLQDFSTALRAMDIFVLPALKQGLGSTMLDAMARGLPVIATESGGVHSVVADNKTGLLVPPSNEQALASRICELLDDPQRARDLGKAAREKVLKDFHIDQMVDSMVTLYKHTIHPASDKKTS